MSSNLNHVYWIGGSPCSGKSSIATVLAEKYGFYYYNCDDAFWRHARAVTSRDCPVFSRVMQLSSEDLWMRPVGQQLRDEITIYREELPLILEELSVLPSDRPILAEGAALLPGSVAPLLSSPDRYIAIVPTPGFQLHHYRQREWWRDVVKDTSDPQIAFANWMEHDMRFARHVRRAAAALALRVLIVQGKLSIVENARIVELHFGLIRDIENNSLRK